MKPQLKTIGRRGLAIVAIAAAAVTFGAPAVRAQCPVTQIASGLQGPLGITISEKGNLLVSEKGTRTPNTGRISIVDPSGNRRTLVDGLPSGLNFEGENQPSGVGGLFLRGRTLYVAVGVGDSVIAGPGPGLFVPNPNPSSPLFSSVLAIHFSANVEKTTAGFTLTAANQHTLANRHPAILSNSAGDRIKIELITNFPSFTPDPRPDFAGNVRNSNPFDLVAVANRLYVTDGGQNALYAVDIATGNFSVLIAFGPIPNPLPFGPPVVEAVPTGITYSGGHLLVTLFRGFPFPAGSSVVTRINPATGNHTPFISSLTTGIDVLTARADELASNAAIHLVLEFSSGDTFSGPGRLLRFNRPDAAPVVIADCLAAPTSMALDSRTGTLYVTQLSGQIAAIPVAAEAVRPRPGCDRD